MSLHKNVELGLLHHEVLYCPLTTSMFVDAAFTDKSGFNCFYNFYFLGGTKEEHLLQLSIAAH